MKKIAIIGAGVSGLASAIRLQNAGYQVDIYEKNKIVGGRMHQITLGDFKFDLGPTIVMMPEIYREVFEICHRNPDDYIPMQQLKNIFDLFYPDETLVIPSDLAQLHSMLENVEEGSAEGFFKYLSDIYERYIIAKKYFITRSFRKASDFYNFKTLRQALKLKTFDSADHLLGKYMKNEKLKRMLSFQTLYIGISPYQGPSLYSIIPMIEMVYGVWYMPGGMYTMASAMEKLCRELRVNIHLNQSVDTILIKKNKAVGILVNGENKLYDYVVSTADFPYTMKELITNKKVKAQYTDKKIEKMDYSCSAYLLYLGVKRQLKDKMNVHNIIFANDFDKNIKDIFNGEFPNDPSIYVYAPSTIDPSLAPSGHETLYILVPVPELKVGKDRWDDESFKMHVRQTIFRQLNRIDALKNIEQDIVVETFVDPTIIQSKFNGMYGSAFGLMPTLLQSNYFRPQASLKTCKNLYFAGASTHPGAGVPIVLTSAKIVAEEIIKDDRKGL